MQSRLIFLAGVGIGYVLGARAGRERYEQLLRIARSVRENPTVQETAGILQAQAGGLMSTAKDSVTDKLSHTKVGNKVSHFLSDQDQRARTGPNGVHGGPQGPSGASG